MEQTVAAPDPKTPAPAPARLVPANHDQRIEINNEVHARPPTPLTPPCRISYLALYSGPVRDNDHAPLAALAERYHVAPPDEGANHYSADLGAFRIRWERHTEFTRFTFVLDGLGEDPFEDTALAAVPADWLRTLEGRTIAAVHAALVDSDNVKAKATGATLKNQPATGPMKSPIDVEALSHEFFGGNVLVGAAVAGGAGAAYTDFRIHPDGFSRFYVLHSGLTPRQAGRTVQRLLEIDTYRVMSLLTLPVARELGPLMSKWERELAEITTELTQADEKREPELLDRLTRLQAGIESKHADTHYRFTAADAYYDLVERRISELRERRFEGLQTFREFTERRLVPAMKTCSSSASRQDDLSRRVARAIQLLSTRVEVSRERQNQQVMEDMNRRAKLQLRLQETVEGLSVAAVTYYAVGLIGYFFGGLAAVGLGIDKEVVMMASIPLVAGLVYVGVHRVRKMVQKEGGGPEI